MRAASRYGVDGLACKARRRKSAQIAVATSLGLIADGAQANAIGPFGVVPITSLILQPLIILVETAVLAGVLEPSFWAIAWRTALANLASFLVGGVLLLCIPKSAANRLTFWALIESLQPGKKIASSRTSLLVTASVFIFWCISWPVEALVLAPLFDRETRAMLWPSLLANSVSYLLLLLVVLRYASAATGQRPVRPR